MAFHRPDPAHFRANDGHGFAFNHGFKRHILDLCGQCEIGASAAQIGVLSEFRLHIPQFGANALPLQFVRPQQVFQRGAFFQQLVPLAAQFHLFQPPQAAQPHVQDRFGLKFGQFPVAFRRGNIVLLGCGARERAAPNLAHQRGAGAFIIADNIDHAVKVQKGDDEAFQHFQPMVNLVQTVLAAAQQHLAPMVKECAQHLAQAANLGRDPVDQHIHVQAEAGFQIGILEQHPHHQFRVNRPRLGFQHDPHIIGGFVAHIGQKRHLAGLDDLCQFLDQAGFRHLKRNFP